MFVLHWTHHTNIIHYLYKATKIVINMEKCPICFETIGSFAAQMKQHIKTLICETCFGFHLNKDIRSECDRAYKNRCFCVECLIPYSDVSDLMTHCNNHTCKSFGLLNFLFTSLNHNCQCESSNNNFIHLTVEPGNLIQRGEKSSPLPDAHPKPTHNVL